MMCPLLTFVQSERATRTPQYISTSPHLHSHSVDTIIPSPSPKGLAFEPEQNPEQTPKDGQSHVSHDGFHEATLFNPRRDEFREAVAPQVLVDSNGNEDTPRDRLVRVNGVGRSDCGQCCNLDTRTSISDDDNDLFIRLVHAIQSLYRTDMQYRVGTFQLQRCS